MGGFFSLDGPFYKFGSILADIMILSLLWFVCSIPLFTIGASNSALYYVTTRRISDREGYLVRDFFKAFKSNFKLATPIFLVIILLYTILVINIMNIEVVGNMTWLVLPVQIVVFIEVTFVTFYIFPLISRFEMKFMSAFKTAFYMANRHMLTTITTTFILLAVLLGCYLYPLFIVISIGVFAFASSYFFMKIFKKYRPEIDKDSFDIDIRTEDDIDVQPELLADAQSESADQPTEYGYPDINVENEN